MTTPEKLREEIAHYEANLGTLVEEHHDEFVLIKGRTIVSFFKTERDAIDAGYDRFGNDGFLVRPCIEAQKALLFTSL